MMRKTGAISFGVAANISYVISALFVFYVCYDFFYHRSGAILATIFSGLVAAIPLGGGLFSIYAVHTDWMWPWWSAVLINLPPWFLAALAAIVAPRQT